MLQANAPSANSPAVGLKENAVGLFRMVYDLTGQLCDWLRNQPGIPGGKAGEKVDGFNIDLVSCIDEFSLTCGSLLLQYGHGYTPLGVLSISIGPCSLSTSSKCFRSTYSM